MPTHSRKHLLGGVVLALCIVLCSSCVEARSLVNKELDNGAKLEWVDCWFDKPLFKKIDCAEFTTAADNGSEVFRLPVVVLRSPSWRRQDTPLLYITGGPGSSSWLDTESIPGWVAWHKEMGWPHDLILFDQRGMGRSQPALTCPQMLPFYRKLMQRNQTVKAEFKQGMKAFAQCRDRLLKSGRDLRDYNTRYIARDIADLIQLMPASEWNLFGSSYGTRVALELMRSHPQKLRSAVLDSVYPPEVNGVLQWPRLLHDAIEGLFQQCDAEAQCRKKYLALRPQWFALQQHLQHKAQRFFVYSWFGEEEIEVVVNDHRLIDIVFYALYNIELRQQLPGAITAAARGDYGPLEPMVENYANYMLDDSFSDAAYNSVQCNDSPVTPAASYRQALAPYPWVERYMKHANFFEICAMWSQQRVPSAFHRPVSSQIPVLLLSGALDPTTPPHWAHAAQQHLRHARHIVFPDIGHGVVESQPCATIAVRDFLRRPKNYKDPRCLQDALGLHNKSQHAVATNH